MRKITEQACHAFENGRNFQLSNTVVKNNAMYLWGNKIAWYDNGDLYISMCGYNTNTTRERLNGLSGVRINSKNYTPYLNGVEIDSYGTYKVSDVVRV